AALRRLASGHSADRHSHAAVAAGDGTDGEAFVAVEARLRGTAPLRRGRDADFVGLFYGRLPGDARCVLHRGAAARPGGGAIPPPRLVTAHERLALFGGWLRGFGRHRGADPVAAAL